MRSRSPRRKVRSPRRSNSDRDVLPTLPTPTEPGRFVKSEPSPRFSWRWRAPKASVLEPWSRPDLDPLTILLQTPGVATSVKKLAAAHESENPPSSPEARTTPLRGQDSQINLHVNTVRDQLRTRQSRAVVRPSSPRSKLSCSPRRRPRTVGEGDVRPSTHYLSRWSPPKRVTYDNNKHNSEATSSGVLSLPDTTGPLEDCLWSYDDVLNGINEVRSSRDLGPSGRGAQRQVVNSLHEILRRSEMVRKSLNTTLIECAPPKLGTSGCRYRPRTLNSTSPVKGRP